MHDMTVKFCENYPLSGNTFILDPLFKYGLLAGLV
jgi:hypothetical protein